MNPETYELLNTICEKTLGRPLESCRPASINGEDASKALWTLNAFFRPLLQRLKTVRYKSLHEPDANEAIKNFAINGDDWTSLSLDVLRIIFERHQQALTLCTANAVGANDVIGHVPAELTDQDRIRFVIAYLLFEMILPFPPTDESQLDIDSPFENQNGQLH